jgi:opacity protein-like surface antigen
MKTLYAMTLLVSMLGSTTASADTFDGYECTDDCSGHQAGYDWAGGNDIDDEDSCDTPSQSFNEGCQSFVQGGSGIVSSDDDDEDE